jgi:hypothetical protein
MAKPKFGAEVFAERLILETQSGVPKNAAREKRPDFLNALTKDDYYDCGVVEKNPQAVGLYKGLRRKPI